MTGVITNWGRKSYKLSNSILTKRLFEIGQILLGTGIDITKQGKYYKLMQIKV